MNSVPIETDKLITLEIPQIATPQTEISTFSQSSPQIYKNAIRTSLRASTVDSVLATVFSLTTGGILLSNFLVELDASPVIFGMLSSIPMLVNFMQPLGAYLSERTTSRFQYSLLTFGIGRLLWLILATGILGASWGGVSSQQLVILTMLIVLFSNLLGSLGSASWLSWIAILVPRRLRGRYFGIRSSAASLTNLLCVPLAGFTVSHWCGGTLQGYGVVLLVGIVAGIVGLGCQYFKLDVNPQMPNLGFGKYRQTCENLPKLPSPPKFWKDSKFLMFLSYFGLWMLAVNLSAPFVNFYMLDTLNLDVSWVALYGSLQAGANLLMLILWGKLADKIGNRSMLIIMGILVALTPLLWLGIHANNSDICLWLPLLHIFTGGTWAAIDLCTNNLQLGIVPARNGSIYFAIAAAVGGVCGALGTTIGSLLAESTQFGGLLGLFALSGLMRFIALVPMFFVQEP
jgi:MFS family permease